MVALRPPPASFDATHAHISLLYVSFLAPRARCDIRSDLGLQCASQHPKRKNSAVCHCKRQCVSCPRPGHVAMVISPPSEQTLLPLRRVTACFGVLRVAFTECPSSRVPEVVIDVDYHQPKPAQPQSAIWTRNGPRERAGRERRYESDSIGKWTKVSKE